MTPPSRRGRRRRRAALVRPRRRPRPWWPVAAGRRPRRPAARRPPRRPPPAGAARRRPQGRRCRPRRPPASWLPAAAPAPAPRPRCDLYAHDRHDAAARPAGADLGLLDRPAPPARRPPPVPCWWSTQGDTVIVTLHNSLPSAVSLAFPGQPADRLHRRALGDDRRRRGAPAARDLHVHRRPRRAPSSTRPGTPPAARGRSPWAWPARSSSCRRRLGVRRAHGSRHGVRRRGGPGAQRGRPGAERRPGDLRHARLPAAYRLINGKPFPATDPISTDQGHKVLLRYVNVGSQTHSMSLLGADQTAGGRRTATRCATPSPRWPSPSSPGATVDTLVTMPTGPEAKVALYEAGGHLDNNGQTDRRPARSSRSAA